MKIKNLKIFLVIVTIFVLLSSTSCTLNDEYKIWDATNFSDNDECRILEATDFSEGKAWVLLSDPYANGHSYWVCIDDSGKAIFQFEPTGRVDVTPYKNGYSYVLHRNGVVNILDAKGNITSTYTPDENGDVLAYGEGYVFTSLNISDFDNNYDLYTIYNAEGNVLYDFTVTYEGEAATGRIRGVNYCGDGVFGMELPSGLDKGPTWFYCAKSNKLITDIQGNTDATFYNDIACVSISPDSGLTFLTSSGNTEIVDLPSDKSYSWNWWQRLYTNEGICLLWRCSSWVDDKCEYMLAYDIQKKSYSGLDSYWLEKIDCENLAENTTFINGYIALPLLGNDGKHYISIFDKSWNNVLEPLACDEFVDFTGKRIVVRLNNDNIVYDHLGNKIFALSELGYSEISKYSNGFAIVSVYEQITDIIVKEKIRYIDEDGNILFEDLALDNQKTIIFENP